MMNQSLTMMMRMMRSLSDTMLNLGGYLQEKAGDLLLLNSSELDLFKQDMATRSMLSSLVSLLQVKKLRQREWTPQINRQCAQDSLPAYVGRHRDEHCNCAYFEIDSCFECTTA